MAEPYSDDDNQHSLPALSVRVRKADAAAPQPRHKVPLKHEKLPTDGQPYDTIHFHFEYQQ
jgi:hypothetical protein